MIVFNSEIKVYVTYCTLRISTYVCIEPVSPGAAPTVWPVRFWPDHFSIDRVARAALGYG